MGIMNRADGSVCAVNSALLRPVAALEWGRRRLGFTPFVRSRSPSVGQRGAARAFRNIAATSTTEVTRAVVSGG